MSTTELSLRVTDLVQFDGAWCATVYCEGQSRAVDRRFGSWRVTPERDADGHQDVRPFIAAELQRQVRQAERRTSKEITMSPSTTTKPASKPAAKSAAKKPAKPAKAKAPAKPKAAKAKPAAKPKATTKAPTSRGDGAKKAAEALALHEGGMSYKEIAAKIGWANPGVAWNAINRAKQAKAASAA